MGLPCDLHDEADLHPGVLMGAAETVDHEEPLSGELVLGELLHRLPYALGHLMVVVGIFGGVPPDGVLGVLVHDTVLVLGGAAGENTSHYVDCAKFGNLSLLKAGQAGLGLFVVENLIGGVVEDFLDPLDTVLAQIQFCHNEFKNFIKLNLFLLLLLSLAKRSRIYGKKSTFAIAF